MTRENLPPMHGASPGGCFFVSSIWGIQVQAADCVCQCAITSTATCTIPLKSLLLKPQAQVIIPGEDLMMTGPVRLQDIILGRGKA